ncbi:protein transport protein YIF1 [Nematocida homosporus]|uniref:protein transport protein YIF1 n=1 Tax=Nematocida homosporus TaxID=1912981 RepID=UPI00221F6510|nr:protein transport protein YIF1 [Nematocida homosporus]KAI5187567.1 protein transport protein YIF1 [Nematocida homosporus]
MNNPLNLDIRQQAFQLGSSYINKTISTNRFESLRRYFQIDNIYLIKKLLLILYPYSHNAWAATTTRDSMNAAIYTPDLYIPLMAAVTYILFLAGELEIQNKFKPEILGKLTSKAIILDFLEVVLVKGMSFFFEARDMEFLDILSFVGYKYVPLVIMKTCALFLNALLRKLVWVALLASFILFHGKSLKYFLISDNAVIDVKKKRMYFLVIAVMIDLLIMVILK